MEQINDRVSEVENSNGGKVKPSRIFKLLDMDGDGYISISDLKAACEKYKVQNSSTQLHALFSELDRFDNGSVDIGEFTRHFETHTGSLLDKMEVPIKAVYHEGGIQHGGPLQEKMEQRDQRIAQGHLPAREGTATEENHTRSDAAERARSEPPSSAGSGRSRMSRAGASIVQTPIITETLPSAPARISDVLRHRYSEWKPHKSELYTSLPRTRFGMTCYPDTRHVTEANMPLSHSFMSEQERFKTMNHVTSIFTVPDHRHPQHEDAIRKHARGEFRVERIRQRQQDFADRCEAANQAAAQFDELKIARKALNQLNYERRCQQACA